MGHYSVKPIAAGWAIVYGESIIMEYFKRKCDAMRRFNRSYRPAAPGV